MGLASRLYNGQTRFRFVPRVRLWIGISLVVVLAGLVSLVTRGLNLGIDFEGGVVWELPAGTASVEDARELMADEGVPEAKVQSLTAGDDERLRIQSEELPEADRNEIAAALAELTGVEVADVSQSFVGASWGEDITEKAVRALIFFLLAITAYVTFRFEFKMALVTVVALIHDLIVTVGVYSITGFEVTPATVIAILTILGFSIYDGIVVFDKVDENTRLVSSTTRMTYSDMVDLSLNQTLMRSLNTSITALLPIASLLVVGAGFMGATTLQEFALALLIGLASGAYSSIFIASPLLAVIKEREPRFRDVRRRIEARASSSGAPVEPLPPVDDVVGVGAPAPAAPSTRGATGVTPAPTGVIPPRPRKKKR
jgi:preprotein translocase subunit SecF